MELVIDGVGKRYGRAVWGLREFGLALRPGVLGLLGPNGAGKSTLMRILATVTRPTTGRVTWDGVDLARDPDAVRRVLGYLPQDFGVYPNLTALEFLEYLAAVKGLDARAARRRIGDLLELVNLTEVARRPLGGFSGGMRQRVGIAQALLNDPRLLIVDEPTAGLDPEERLRFYHLLTEMSQDRIVLLSTHIVEDVAVLCPRFAVILDGRLIAKTTPHAAREALAGTILESVVTPAELPELRRRHHVIQAILVEGRHRVRIHAPDGEAASGFERVTPTLEDAYLVLMRSGSRRPGENGSAVSAGPAGRAPGKAVAPGVVATR
jgi:ABC-type multidrug transport system ATPase subunit